MSMIKIAGMTVIFLVGVMLVLDGLSSVSSLWLLVPGCILLLISYPAIHYYFDKIRFGYRDSRERDALKEAKLANIENKENNGKK
jgi:membrane protein required for beta-lactamase induction